MLGADGWDALANEVRAMVKAGVKRGKLRRAFDDEFAARIEQAFLDVTASHVRRVFESEQPAFQRSLSRVPKKIREWLNAEAVTSEADRADAT